MAFWWVNHKQTRDHEVRGGYLWSPFRNANGAFNQTYENMKFVRPGDIVFSYANGQIGAIGQVTEAAAASPKPTEFGKVGDYWAHEGWLVSVYFTPAPKPLRPTAHSTAIAPLLPDRHSPIRPNGHGNQGCYLASISDALGLLLLTLLGVEAQPAFTHAHGVNEASHDTELLEDLQQIDTIQDVPETQRLQLAKARIGQGLFRSLVMLDDPRCRVTGVEDARLLIASHIKPWRDSTNQERISRDNGIMLSPHVDALFDKHLLTFEDDGRIRIHTSIPRDVLDRWAIHPDERAEKFRPEQSAFLSHHRELFAAKVA
ncbi:MAG TPA: HNH endonuclease [Luteimonas sp.]|nr:HNH endonuclease [Luteimonas sp.]HRO26076.1 HNH endonuclease [Luteimonas sp.]HRP72479.1 HNH endonuclease [Luteimonas sp.]